MPLNSSPWSPLPWHHNKFVGRDQRSVTEFVADYGRSTLQEERKHTKPRRQCCQSHPCATQTCTALDQACVISLADASAYRKIAFPHPATMALEACQHDISIFTQVAAYLVFKVRVQSHRNGLRLELLAAKLHLYSQKDNQNRPLHRILQTIENLLFNS